MNKSYIYNYLDSATESAREESAERQLQATTGKEKHTISKARGRNRSKSPTPTGMEGNLVVILSVNK